MASGRLGSALIPAKRTTVVYDNTSGGSAAISLMAKMRSSTSNGTISILLDSSSTAAETTTQIDSNSYTKNEVKLTYNSPTPASVSSVTGKIAYTTYGSATKTLTVTDLSDNSVTSSSNTLYGNPQWMSSDYPDWGLIATHIARPNASDNSGYVKFVTPAQQQSEGLNWFKSNINSGVSISSSFNSQISYGNNYGSTDLYCDMVPSFYTNTSAYMATVYLNGTSGGTHQRTSNSLIYSYITSSDPGSSYSENKHIHASGGIVIFNHRNHPYSYIVCYGRRVPTTQRIENVIENNPTSFGSTYPYHYKYSHDNYESNTNIMNTTFFEYNPNTGYSYGVLYWDGKRRLLEFDVDAWETALSNDNGSTGNTIQSFDQTVSAGLITDISSVAPTIMLEDDTRMAGPIVRSGKSNWIIPLRTLSGSYETYETTDFKSYTLYDNTQNYSELLSDEISVSSTGSVTNKLTSNYSSLDKSGTIEHDTSFNQLERTGLVISNNDRVVVRNNGDSDLAVQVMGYEE
jgi:hypothetical protein